MNVCLFYYDGFCEFEVVLAANEFHEHLTAVSLENRVYVSEENQKFLPDRQLSALDPDDIDLFIIPGGDPSVLYEESALRDLLYRLNEKGKLIAGICGGAELLAYYGLLDGKNANGDYRGFVVTEENKHIYEKINISSEPVVRDGNIITSKGMAYEKFADVLWEAMGMEQ